MLRLGNGNTLVNWGSPTGLIREVTPDGATAWEVRPFSAAGLPAEVYPVLPFRSFDSPDAE